MSVLSDTEILQEIKAGSIVIEPFRRSCLGSNSYDVHLGEWLGIYESDYLDCKLDDKIKYIQMNELSGFQLQPGQLYLGVTEEFTDTGVQLLPNIDGKSSIGRKGIFVHVTAGRGDAAFQGHWTLEIVCVKPVVIYPGMPIAQLTYETIRGKVARPYNKKKDAKYANHDPRPMQSMMWKNWDSERKSWVQED